MTNQHFYQPQVIYTRLKDIFNENQNNETEDFSPQNYIKPKTIKKVLESNEKQNKNKKGKNNSEEEEESDKEDKLEHEKNVFIKSPIINEKKLKTPQITKKHVIINNKKTPLNAPIVVYKEIKDPLQREYNQKGFKKRK